MTGNPLTDALQASLHELGGSPLDEIDPYSVEEQFERINSRLAAGMPETISADDPDLLVIISRLRAQRHHFNQVSEKREKTRAEGGAKRKKAGPKSVTAVLNETLDVGEL